MRCRASSIALTALLFMGICAAPAQAGEEPAAYRLTGAVLSREGETAVRYTFRYPEGGALPGEEKMEYPAGERDGYVYAYTYDEAGHMMGTVMCSVLSMDHSGEEMPVVTERSAPVNEARYTYDGQGRVSGAEVYVDGALAEQTTYTYDEAPLLTLQHCSQQDYDGEGRALQEPVRFFVAQLKDAAGQTVLRFDLQGQPELTFDSAGYLVKAEAAGRTLEFTYEPAA